jgi:hypothetical protein
MLSRGSFEPTVATNPEKDWARNILIVLLRSKGSFVNVTFLLIVILNKIRTSQKEYCKKAVRI